jgi:hypothetical protein
MTAELHGSILNLEFPVLVFTSSVVVLWLFAHIGALIRTRVRGLGEDEREDFGVVIGATLTLLGLLIGFTFSMAISRYDQRKNYEEEEANAIGTEYLRADILPATNAAAVHELMVKYLDDRVLFYRIVDEDQLAKIDSDTAQLQREMWSEVRAVAAAQPTPTVALVVAGMNDVLNAQGYTQAAWWNRIPTAAWMLMAAIAICCNLLIGYAAHRSNGMVFLILPLAVSVSFLLIADIDSPRGGLIRVRPHNLVSLSQSLTAPSARPEP